MDRQIRLTVDGGWAWLVCAACFSIQFVVFGIIQSYGTIFIALLKEFKSGESEAAWVGSLAFGLIFLNGPMSTALIGHFGYRKIACLGTLVCSLALLTTSFATSLSSMYLTFSIAWGMGASFSFFSSLLVLRFYFNQKLSLANGIAMAGSAAGTLILNLAIGKMNESVGWRTTLRILSALSAGTSVCGCAFLPPPEVCPVAKQWAQYEKVSLWKKIKRMVDARPWKNKAFLVYLTALCFILFGYFVPYVHLVRLAETRGVPTSEGTLLVGYLSTAQIFGKLLFGRLADHRWFNKVYLLSFAGFVLCLSTACATLAQDYGGLMAFALVFGFFDGGLVVIIPLIATLIVGREQMANAFGGMYGILSIPMTLGPPLSAALYDHTGSYSLAFYSSSSLIAVGISLMYVFQRLNPSIMGRTEIWPDRETATHSLVEDNAMNIHVANTVSADALSGMCLADTASLARERAAMEHAQIDAESISLSTIFPVSRMVCDPLSHTSYSVSTQCSDATISLIVPDIFVIPPSDSANMTSETHNSTGINSLSSMVELQTVEVEEMRADNEELFRAALENLARKEKETTNREVESDYVAQPHLVTSNIDSLKQQETATLTSPERLSIASSNVNGETPKHVSKVGGEIENDFTPQSQLDTQELQGNTSEPLISVDSVLIGYQADDDTQLELVPVPPPPPDTPRRTVTPLVELGGPDIMFDVEHLDFSRLTSTSHSIPESLMSIQESLRSRQDISIGSSMLFDHCMFADSAQVSALSERLEAVAAHRRSLEEAELTALLTSIEGATTNNQAVSEADEEILQVRIPPPPSSSKRRSCTSSVSYDSPVPALIDQILSSSSLSRNHSEGDFIFGLPEGIGSPLSIPATPLHFGVGTSGNKQEKTRDAVDYLGFTKASLKTNEGSLALSERHESQSAPLFAPVVENWEQDETEIEQFIDFLSPELPVFETSKAQQEVGSIEVPDAQKRKDVNLSIASSNSNSTDTTVSTAPEGTDHSILIHQEKVPSLDVFGMPKMKDIQSADVENDISQFQQYPLRETADDLRKNALPANASVLPAEISLTSLSSKDIEQIPSSTLKDEIWRKDFVLRPDSQESLLKHQSGYKVTTVQLETNTEIVQTTSSDVPQEVDSITDSFVVVEIMEKMPVATMNSEKERSPTWEQINKDLELLIRQESFHAQSMEQGNQEEVLKQPQENILTVSGTANSPMPLHSVMESSVDASVPKREDTTNVDDKQLLHYKEMLTTLETGVITKPTKVDSQAAVFKPLLQPYMQATLVVNNMCKPQSMLVSPKMSSETVPETTKATAEAPQAAVQPELCYPPQRKTSEDKTFHSEHEQHFQSETKNSDGKIASLTADYKENNIKGIDVSKQLKLNPRIHVFNESDDSSADEDATNAKQEVRELVGVEPLIAGSEILPKEYWRDLERARTRKGRPLSGSSSGSQSGYSTDTSFSESDNEGVNVHYVKIPELSEPEDDSK